MTQEPLLEEASAIYQSALARLKKNPAASISNELLKLAGLQAKAVALGNNVKHTTLSQAGKERLAALYAKLCAEITNMMQKAQARASAASLESENLGSGKQNSPPPLI